jgi:monofunctional biosynthetic peptidoglycan transglycosylase
VTEPAAPTPPQPAASAESGEGPRRGRRLARSIVRIALVAVTAALLSPLLVILGLRWIDPPTSAFMVQRAVGRRLDDDSSVAGWRRIDYRWTDLGDIAPAMPLAVVAAEDQLFPHHHGFDVESIRDVLAERRLRRQQEASGGRGTNHARSERRLRRQQHASGGRGTHHARRERGASTITQQVAKNLFLWPGRSLVRKGIEAYLAAAIELLWPKRRILEVYLNIAEMGTDIYGVTAAADVYFGRTPSSLTRRQAALLAAALPNPRRRHPDRPSEWLSERARWIETQIDQLGGAAHLAGVLD